MYFLLKIVIFQCYVSFQGCNNPHHANDFLRAQALEPVLRKGLRDGMVNLPSGRWAKNTRVKVCCWIFEFGIQDMFIMGGGWLWGCFFTTHPGRNLTFFKNVMSKWKRI